MRFLVRLFSYVNEQTSHNNKRSTFQLFQCSPTELSQTQKHVLLFVGELVLLSSLDRETTPSYELVIAVSDGGFDGDDVLSASATVDVTVLDTNEFSPQFDNGTVYQVAVKEEATQDNITTVINDKYTCVGHECLFILITSTKHTHPRTHIYTVSMRY